MISSVFLTNYKPVLVLSLSVILMFQTLKQDCSGEGNPENLTSGNVNNQINWWVFDIEPAHYIKGKKKGNGIYGSPQSFITEKLHHYEHMLLTGNIARILNSLKNDDHACVNGGFYGPEYPLGFKVAYSIPNTMLYPHGIIVRKEDLNRFGGGNAVSLTELLDNFDLRFGYALGDKAGQTLNAIIEKRINQKNVYLRSSRDRILEGLLKMIVTKRIDYTTIYPHNFAYYSEKKEFKNIFSFIPIKENHNEVILISVNCPDTDWGYQVIEEINHVLIKYRDTPAYRRMILETGVAPPGNEQEYWKLFQDNVLSIQD